MEPRFRFAHFQQGLPRMALIPPTGQRPQASSFIAHPTDPCVYFGSLFISPMFHGNSCVCAFLAVILFSYAHSLLLFFSLCTLFLCPESLFLVVFPAAFSLAEISFIFKH